MLLKSDIVSIRIREKRCAGIQICRIGEEPVDPLGGLGKILEIPIPLYAWRASPKATKNSIRASRPLILVTYQV